uniref:Uncharacterized protein n=1 Tax=Anguilla anguilla TaxID=7936 RepID=A0A0E9X088_ANGAN
MRKQVKECKTMSKSRVYQVPQRFSWTAEPFLTTLFRQSENYCTKTGNKHSAKRCTHS